MLCIQAVTGLGSNGRGVAYSARQPWGRKRTGSFEPRVFRSGPLSPGGYRRDLTLLRQSASSCERPLGSAAKTFGENQTVGGLSSTRPRLQLSDSRSNRSRQIGDQIVSCRRAKSRAVACTLENAVT